MPDEIDFIVDREERILDATVRATGGNPVPGSPGTCGKCGEPSERLVRGVCAPCRDKWKLP